MQKINEQGLYDIYSLWYVPFWQRTEFYIAVGITIAIILGIAAYFFVRWYRKKNAVPKTAWENALEQLTQLQQKKYESKEDGKSCYFAMTTILKKYLATRYAYPIDGKTDEEMITYLAKSTEQKLLADELKEIIDGCLYIKFANAQAMQESIEKHLEQSCAIIKRTIPAQTNQHTK